MQFGRVPRLKLEPPPKLQDLVSLAVTASPPPKESGISIDQATEASPLVHFEVERLNFFKENMQTLGGSP